MGNTPRCTIAQYNILTSTKLHQINREECKNARILANPGCYPTAAQLPLVPLLKAGLILPEDIIIDAKSGTVATANIFTLDCFMR